MNYADTIPLRELVLPEKQRQMFLDMFRVLLKKAEKREKTSYVQKGATHKNDLPSLTTDEDWMKLNRQMEKSLLFDR